MGVFANSNPKQQQNNNNHLPFVLLKQIKLAVTQFVPLNSLTTGENYIKLLH